MKTVKKLLLAGLLSMCVAASPGLAGAAGAGVQLDSARIDMTNQAALQRGAKYFVNYCQGCHSLNFMRYGRLARDLGLTDQQVMENLNFTSDKIGDAMSIAMRSEDSEAWFGNPVPDLSVIARARGVDWLYTYLRTFYVDESRVFGVSNLVFPDVGMPHVLWELQGLQKPIWKETADERTAKQLDRFEIFKPGSMDAVQYDRTVRDIVTFLAYVGEPGKLQRQRLGVWVLLFLAVFLVIAYLLKKEYWKDVH